MLDFLKFKFSATTFWSVAIAMIVVFFLISWLFAIEVNEDNQISARLALRSTDSDEDPATVETAE